MKVLLMAKLFWNHRPYVAQFETTLDWVATHGTDPMAMPNVLPQRILEVSMMTESGMFRQQFPDPELMEVKDEPPTSCR